MPGLCPNHRFSLRNRNCAVTWILTTPEVTIQIKTEPQQSGRKGSRLDFRKFNGLCLDQSYDTLEMAFEIYPLANIAIQTANAKSVFSLHFLARNQQLLSTYLGIH